MLVYPKRQLVLGLVVYVMGAVLAIFLAWLTIRSLLGLRQEVLAPTLIGALTIVGTAWGGFAAAQRARRRDIEQEHRLQKIPVYGEFMHAVFEAFMSSRTGTAKLNEKRLTAAMLKFNEKLILWGGDEVVGDWTELRRLQADHEGGGEEATLLLLYRWEQFFFALRRDVGHNNAELSAGDLLGLFINDLKPKPEIHD